MSQLKLKKNKSRNQSKKAKTQKNNKNDKEYPYIFYDMKILIIYTPKEVVGLVEEGFINPFMVKGEETRAPAATETVDIEEKVTILVALL